MAAFTPRRPRPSASKRLRQVTGRTGPLFAWMLLVAATVWLGRHEARITELPALVDASHGTVRAPNAGRITTLLVGLHDMVDQGHVIARLDDSDLRLRLQQAQFELERLRAEMLREQADRQQQAQAESTNQQLERSSERRRLQSDIEAAQLAALSTRTQLEETKVRLQGAAIEAERQQQLGEQGMVGGTVLVRIETERQALQKRVDQLDYLLTEQRERIRQTEQRLAEFAALDQQQPPLDTALEPLRWRLKEQEALLERLAADGRDLDLRAPISGRVAAVERQAGEWLPAGAAVVALIDPTPRRILAFAPESLPSPLQPGQTVRVQRQDRAPLGTTTVLSVAPALVQLPARLWRDPQVPEWGRELVLATTGKELPGERLLIRP